MAPCDLPVLSAVCEVAGDAAGALVAAPFEWLALSMGQAAGWMVESVWEVIDATTIVNLSRPAYVEVYNTVFGVAVFLMLLLFTLQLLRGLVRREPRAFAQAITGLAKSVVGSFVAIALTTLLLEATDQLSRALVAAAGTTMEQLGARIATLVTGLSTLVLATPGAGAIVTMGLAGLAILGVLMVWGSMLVRTSLLLVTVALAPLALAGWSWQPTRAWAARWASFVVALVVSKFVVVLIFLVGTVAIAPTTDGEPATVADPLAGIVLLFLAGFAPAMTHRFIAFAGIDVHQLVAAEHDTSTAVRRAVPATPIMRSGIAKVVGPAAAGPAAPAAPAAAAAPVVVSTTASRTMATSGAGQHSGPHGAPGRDAGPTTSPSVRAPSGEGGHR